MSDTKHLLSPEDHETQPKPTSDKAKLAEEICIGIWFLLTLTGIVIILTLYGPGSYLPGAILSYEDLFNITLQPSIPTIVWFQSGRFAVRKSVNGTSSIIQYDASTLQQTVLLNQSQLVWNGRQLEFSSFQVSSNGSHLLIPVDVQKIWRHSFKANYVIYDVITKSIQMLANMTNSTNPNIQLATWSPLDNTIAFVMNNNIYLQNGTAIRQITFDGEDNKIINGVMDWVYEEEVFEDTNAIWWAPDAKKLAFLRVDETPVQTFSFEEYNNVDISPYTTPINIKYPKSGTNNPIVKVHIYDLETNVTVPMDTGNDEYITDVAWQTASSLMCRTENRLQQVETAWFFNITSFPTVTSRNFTTQRFTFGWVEPTPGSIVFVNPPLNDQFIMIKNNSEYYHAVLIDANTGYTIRYLTNGTWDVNQIAGFNQVTQDLYYLTGGDDPTSQHVYGVNIHSGTTTKYSKQDGYYRTSFNKEGTFFILTYTGPNLPYTDVYSVQNAGTKIGTIEDNAQVQSILNNYVLPVKAFLKIQANNTTLNSWVMYPPRSNPADQFGLLFNVYTGPGSQTVTQTWTLGLNEYIASQLGIIVVSVDTRGTGARGIQFKQQTYLNLGTLEAEDLLLSRTYLLNTLERVDPKRTAIWGWSYGGYMTLRTLLKGGANGFLTGVSVAPVTDWQLYDTFYTERYMSTPTLNRANYNSTSVLENAQGFANVTGSFLLIHGTGDDNVHFQNTVTLNNLLIKYNIQYDTMFYANRDHSINSDGARKHLYKLVSNYLAEHIGN